jgi:hypothetical protein
MRLKSRPASFDRLTVVRIFLLFRTTAHPQSTALTRIFYANRDKLRDPDQLQAGQKLTIPPES